MATFCPCGSQQELENCCQPLIDGVQKPQTAEELMRSRYTAYSIGNEDYVYHTHDPKHRKGIDRQANKRWADSADWLGLEIKDVQNGGPEDTEGTVEFVASYEMSGERVDHHELSTFRKRGGEWYFVDGRNPNVKTVQREEPKVGRNDPCPCGSGKKFKKCCGA